MARFQYARGSFQQLLLFAFLLITALLVGVSLRSVFQFDALITQSRDAAARALTLSGATQFMAERSAAMERAARQSLVLDDAVLRRRFSDAAREANAALDRLGENGLATAPAGDWRQQLAVISGLLGGPPETSLARERELAVQFRELDGFNTRIAQQVQLTIQTQNEELASRIEATRTRLMRQVLLRFNAAAFEARQLNRQRTALLPLLEEQVEAQRLQWQAQGLSVQVGGEPVTAAIDAAKFGMALANLLSNAIRFSPRGGTIGLTVSSAPGVARIDVSDDGPGIPASERDRIFEPFFRGEQQPQQAVRGTGIGLSIVQEYIAAHGGSVKLLQGTPGTRFRIEFPYSP